MATAEHSVKLIKSSHLYLYKVSSGMITIMMICINTYAIELWYILAITELTEAGLWCYFLLETNFIALFSC